MPTLPVVGLRDWPAEGNPPVCGACVLPTGPHGLERRGRSDSWIVVFYWRVEQGGKSCCFTQRDIPRRKEEGRAGKVAKAACYNTTNAHEQFCCRHRRHQKTQCNGVLAAAGLGIRIGPPPPPRLRFLSLVFFVIIISSCGIPRPRVRFVDDGCGVVAGVILSVQVFCP